MEFHKSFLTAKVSKQNTGGPQFVQFLGPGKDHTMQNCTSGYYIPDFHQYEFYFNLPKVIESIDLLRKQIWTAIETTLFYYSGDMYSWSSLILISHLMFQTAYNTKKTEKTGMLQANDFQKIFVLFAILPRYFYDIPK